MSIVWQSVGEGATTQHSPFLKAMDLDTAEETKDFVYDELEIVLEKRSPGTFHFL
jgi:hypothetical protein